MTRLADRLLTPILVALGFIMMVTPLALWLAWSETVLLIVLATCVAAGALYCLLVRFEPPAAPAEEDAAVRSGFLPDELLDELQSLHPFVYHNRLSREGRVRVVMRRLRAYLYAGPD